MTLNKNKNLKLYYSIKEVAEMFDVNESTLRYWEKEFPLLKPKTVSTTKVRQYTDADIEQIRTIHNLVKKRGFRLAAAKKMLSQNRHGVDKTMDVMDTLTEMRTELLAIKKQLDRLE